MTEDRLASLWRRLRPRGRPAICSILLALAVGAVLAGCGEQPVSPPVAGATETPRATVVPPGETPTATPVPTATPEPTAFAATIREQNTVVTCASSQPQGTTCLNVSGSGNAPRLGTVTVNRTAQMLPPGADSCGSSTTSGTITTASGETITFRGKGTFCRATTTAKYTYTITGGTGRYKGATGTGTLVIPRMADTTTPTATWSGTLILAS